MAESSTKRVGDAAVPLIKSYFIDSDDDLLAAVEDLTQTSNNVFEKTEAIPPPFDPLELSRFLEISGALRTNVDAYAANIDGNGHQYEPIVDLGDESAREIVRQAMYEEFLEKSLTENGYEVTAQTILKKITSGEDDISDDEVDAKIAEIRHQMSAEMRVLERFFNNCCTDMSFAKLRRVTRQDYEVLGNAYWEVIRKGDEPYQINLVPGATVRLLPRMPPIEVERPLVHSVIRMEMTTQMRSFRKYVQLLRAGIPGSSTCRYFKQYGDPRVFSASTGQMYESEDELKSKEPKSLPATEMLHFKIHSSRTPYGVPRWISEAINVLGTRHAEQVNLMYFENKSVPPLAILVSGGSLAAESVTRVRDYIKNEIRGSKNFHKILILEAESGDTIDPTISGHVRIEIKPLAQQQEAMFMEYMDKCRDSLGMVFRNPRIVRGDTRDFNKSCYSEDTETLTLRGWKKLREFLPDDRIAAYNPDTKVMEYVVPEALHIYDVDEELCHFKNRSLDVLVTDNHRMLVKSGHFRQKHSSDFVVHRADSIPWAKATLKTTVEDCVGPEFVGFGLDVEGDIFLEFLGYWLSWGSLTPTGVILPQKRAVCADKIFFCLEATGWKYSESYCKEQGCHIWTISNPSLAAWLRENCGEECYNKRFPDTVKPLCKRQGRILFDALMLGGRQWLRRKNYSSESAQLCDDVQALAVSIGYRANMRPPNRKGSAQIFRVQISRKGDTQAPGRPERVKYTGKVYCFSVPGYEFFVTRRNGKVAVQGNTSESALLFTEQQVYAPERKDFDWLMNKEVLPELGVRLWRFASKGPDVTDPTELNKMLVEAAKEGFLSLAELRRKAEKVYGPLPIFRSWTNEVPLFVLRQHQTSLKYGGIAGFEQEMGAPAPRVLADEQTQQSEDNADASQEPEDG